MIKKIRIDKHMVIFFGLSLTLTSFLIFTDIIVRSSVSADKWPMFHGDVCRTGFSETIPPNLGYLEWKFKFSNETGIFMVSPVVADGKVYVTAPFLRCLNLSTGEELWSNSTIGVYALAPAVAYDKVFVCNFSKIYCLDANTGAHIWTFDTTVEFTVFNSAPVIAESKVFIGNEGGVWCLNATTGNQIRHFGQPALGPVAVDNDRLFVAAYNVYCLNTTTGMGIWHFPLTTFIQASPAVAYGGVFIGTRIWANQTGILYCLNETIGNEIWNFTTNTAYTAIFSSPAVAYQRVVVAAGTKLYCLRVDNGGTLWTHPFDQGILSSPAIADFKVILGVYDMNVYCLTMLNGNTIWKYTTGDGIASSPALADGKVFICSDDGYLYCFGPDTILPTIQITYPPDMAILNSSLVTISGNASDNFQVKVVKVRTNYGSWVNAIGTTTWRINVTLSLGANIIEAQAFDAADNPSSIASINITLDNLLAIIHTPVQSLPPENVPPNQEVKVSVLITDEGSGIKNATLHYEINETDMWTPKPMNYNNNTGLYETEIPGQPPYTYVRYKIVAYDFAGNKAEQDNSGNYYVYTVIPEFPAILILPIFMGTTAFIVVLAGRKKPKA